MKKFYSATAKIKNSEGDWITLPALRGATSYEVAVRNGFKGTEGDWLALMIDDGWVAKYQELDTAKADKAEVLRLTSASSSYLAFAGNVNSTMLDAAFGKNNEDSILAIGRALQLYANFKGDTTDNSYLTPYDKFEDIVKDYKQEISSNSILFDLIQASPYAKEVYQNTFCGLPDIVIYDSGTTEYLDFDNAAIELGETDDTTTITTYPDYITIDHKTSPGTYSSSCTSLTYTVPLVKSIPNVYGYRYLNVQLADGSYLKYSDTLVGNPGKDYTVDVAVGGISNIVMTGNGYDSYDSGYCYHSGKKTVDLFKTPPTIPLTDNLIITIQSPRHSSTAYFHMVNIEKIWFSEA